MGFAEFLKLICVNISNLQYTSQEVPTLINRIISQNI